jgi:hypothetical protein
MNRHLVGLLLGTEEDWSAAFETLTRRTGPGWLPCCVLLPHARRRLHTDDPARMAELAASPPRAALSSLTARVWT